MTPDPEDARFPSTSWTLIERVKSGDAATAAEALAEICSGYRYPLYCYLRRRGLDHHDAEDVLHDFLARFLRHGSFEAADEAKGRLRGYLGTSLARHLNGWFSHRSRRPHLADGLEFDGRELESNYARENFAENESPDAIFERKWALAMLHNVTAQLAAQYSTRGKDALFAALRPVILAGGSLRGHDAPAIAVSLGMTEEALRAALHRMLREFRNLLRAEVRQTVEAPDEIDAELDHLRRLFAR